jgi:K+-transporting ATPase KdpF subunit
VDLLWLLLTAVLFLLSFGLIALRPHEAEIMSPLHVVALVLALLLFVYLLFAMFRPERF